MSSAVLWTVEVELLGWPRLRRTRALRTRLAAASEVVCVLKVPLTESIVAPARLGTGRVAPTVKIKVAADSPAAASRLAKAIVDNALTELGASAEARPWIISTDGVPAGEVPVSDR